MVQKFENKVLVNTVTNLMARRIIVAIICIAVCMCVSMVGLDNIIKYAYGYCGYLGLVVITVPMLTIGHKKNKEYIGDRYITISYSNTRNDTIPVTKKDVMVPIDCRCIFVKNLPYDVTEEEIRAVFMYGRVS